VVRAARAARAAAAEEEEERERERRIGETRAKAGPSLREEELKRLSAALAPHELRLHEIAADGHCLYRSIAHQLAAGDEASALDFRHCRRLAAEYIRSHADDFLPFLLAEHDFSDGLLESYCSQVRGWG